MIIDAHAHITPGLAGRHGPLPTASLPYGEARMGQQVVRVLPPIDPEPTRFEAATLLRFMDWVGVERVVLLQGPFYGPLNDYLQRAASQWPDRFVPAAYVDPRAPEGRHQFHQAVDQFGFRIVKLEISSTTGLVGMYPDFHLDEEASAWLVEGCAERGLVLTLDLGAPGTASYQTEAVARIAGRYPELKIVIAHLAQPPLGHLDDAGLDRAWQQQIELGRRPNVWFDTSALPAYGSFEYPYPQAVAFLRRAYDTLGPGKLMWGSDIPGLLAQATYRQLLDLVRLHCDFFPDEERKAVLGETAATVYG